MRTREKCTQTKIETNIQLRIIMTEQTLKFTVLPSDDIIVVAILKE